MKKSAYKDFKNASEYFTDTEKFVNEEVSTVENQKKFIVWVQEFSKKIVVIIFTMYIIFSLFSLYLVWLSFQSGSISGIDTLISELNQTFREVVGGYIIKSAVENSFKIAGNYLVGIYDAKLKAMKHKLTEEGIGGLDNSEEENTELFETE